MIEAPIEARTAKKTPGKFRLSKEGPRTKKIPKNATKNNTFS